MAVYEVYNKDGEFENIIVIEPDQVTKYEQLTGLRLELPPEPEFEEQLDPAVMEAALNELGVETRE